MFKDIASKNTDKSSSNDKVTAAFNTLISDMNNKADADVIMTDVHVNLHPELVSGYNIQVVPEFPLPLLVAVVSIVGIIAMTKSKPIKLMP
jgi:hypothetical protein